MRRMADFVRVSPQEAKALLEEGYVYVDVRSVPEFDQERPAGSFNVPLMNVGPGGMAPNAEFLAVMMACFPKDTKLVVGCKSGQRSMRAAQMLMQSGYTMVVDLRTGFDGTRNPFGQLTEPGWKGAGLAIESGGAEEKSYQALAAKR
jgi:rhodanese-related sulfurtransferase